MMSRKELPNQLRQSGEKLPNLARTGLIKNRKTGLPIGFTNRFSNRFSNHFTTKYDSDSDSDSNSDSDSDSNSDFDDEMTRARLVLEAQSWDDVGEVEYEAFRDDLSQREATFADMAVESQYHPDGIKMLEAGQRFTTNSSL